MKYDSRRPRQGMTLGVVSCLAIYASVVVVVWGLRLLGSVFGDGS